MPEPADPLIDLVCLGFEHALASIERGGPFIPFALTESAGQRTLTRFVAETLEQGIERGREQFRALDPKPDRALIAFDGYVRDGASRTDAIFIEAQDLNAPCFSFFQRYTPPKGLLRRKTKPLDDAPVLANEGANLI